MSVAGLNVPATVNGKAATPPAEASAMAEAISALINLGYNPAQANAAIAIAASDLGNEAETAKLIRRGLKELAR